MRCHNHFTDIIRRQINSIHIDTFQSRVQNLRRKKIVFPRKHLRTICIQKLSAIRNVLMNQITILNYFVFFQFVASPPFIEKYIALIDRDQYFCFYINFVGFPFPIQTQQTIHIREKLLYLFFSFLQYDCTVNFLSLNILV